MFTLVIMVIANAVVMAICFAAGALVGYCYSEEKQNKKLENVKTILKSPHCTGHGLSTVDRIKYAVE
jgi:hypothetical protein